jgi:hypothetical protein
MNMIQCPHCGKPGISALQKFSVGSARTVLCQECGQKVGVPYWSICTFFPAISGVIIIPLLLADMPQEAALCAGLLIIISWMLWEVAVPLIKK